MLPVKEENFKGLEMSFTLNDRESALLGSYVKQEAFDILQRLMEQEIRLLNIKLINLEKRDEIVAAHAVAKGAGMFYAGVMQRLSDILQIEQIKSLGIGTLENPEIPPMIDEVS